MITFLCENCGKLLEAQLPQQDKVKCPSCNSISFVPAGLKTLPSPILPTQNTFISPKEIVNESSFEKIQAYFMPWIMSFLLHVGLLIILLFVVAFTVPPTPPKHIEIGNTNSSFSPENPGEKLGFIGKIGTGPKLNSRGPTGDLPLGKNIGWAPINQDTTSAKGWGIGNDKGTTEAYGFGGASEGGGGIGDFGMARGGGTKKSNFYGTGSGDEGDGSGNAWNVIYVLDSSGSVVSSFDNIRQELKSSIFKLNTKNDLQSVHVIFFGEDTFQEAPSRRLVKADMNNKREIAKYVDRMVARGHGSSPIPAMIRAFSSFKNSNKKGQIMYILTDGEFDVSKYTLTSSKGQKLQGTEAVIEWLRENNPNINIIDKNKNTFIDKFVHVYVIVLGETPSQEVETSMRIIAKENGGEYKFVPR